MVLAKNNFVLKICQGELQYLHLHSQNKRLALIFSLYFK